MEQFEEWKWEMKLRDVACSWQGIARSRACFSWPDQIYTYDQIQAQMAALPLSYRTADGGGSQLHGLTSILLSVPVVNQSQMIIFFSLLLSPPPLSLSLLFVKSSSYRLWGQRVLSLHKFSQEHTAPQCSTFTEWLFVAPTHRLDAPP